KTDGTSQSSNTNSPLLLRRGWTVRRLWILSIVGVAGLGLDAVFHTLDSGTPLTIIFDGADFSTGQMVLTSSPEVATLSWVGHITFLVAFALLVVLPKLFFESSQTLRSPDGRNWAVLKRGRSIKQLWIIAMVGVAGMALDVAFHWIQDGSVDQVLLNGSDNPDPFVAALALAAHTLFLGAFSLLIFLPKILFDTNREKVPPITR
ncbi:MAG TPA: hypothetical protein VFR94_08070, partial [Nitrososphaeraceae archaeon]|nr:hypothetical protein [Nitrososphaeraceae archaeon]